MVFCAGFGARCVRVDKVAVFDVHKRSIIDPLSTYCKIRYVSKFTAASHGSPSDSTAFLFYIGEPRLFTWISKVERVIVYKRHLIVHSKLDYAVTHFIKNIPSYWNVLQLFNLFWFSPYCANALTCRTFVFRHPLQHLGLQHNNYSYMEACMRVFWEMFKSITFTKKLSPLDALPFVFSDCL